MIQEGQRGVCKVVVNGGVGIDLNASLKRLRLLETIDILGVHCYVKKART